MLGARENPVISSNGVAIGNWFFGNWLKDKDVVTISVAVCDWSHTEQVSG